MAFPSPATASMASLTPAARPFMVYLVPSGAPGCFTKAYVVELKEDEEGDEEEEDEVEGLVSLISLSLTGLLVASVAALGNISSPTMLSRTLDFPFINVY